MTLTQPESLRVRLPLTSVAAACERFGVRELAVFGSALRDDFDPARSDMDFLVRFVGNDAGPWMGKMTDLREELSRVLDREVDLADWEGVLQSENPYRRRAILQGARTVYVA